MGAGAMLLIAPAFAFAASTPPSDAAVEGLIIRRVDVQPLNLFEPLPGGPLRPMYRLANRLHITTRPRVIRQQLLFRRGEPWSRARGEETLRVLRALDILEPVRLETRQVGDSVDVKVVTRDSWTTAPQVSFEAGGGQHFFSFSVVERNLFGLAKSISFAYDHTPEGVYRSLAFHDPAFGGSRWSLGVSTGTGGEGVTQSFELARPFYAEDTRQAFGFRTALRTSVARLYERGQEAAWFDRRVEEIDAWWGRGVRRGPTIWRLSALTLLRTRRFGPSQLMPGADPGFGGGEENRRARLVGLDGRWWRPDFREWTGVDRLGTVEDIDLGPSLQLVSGLSPRGLGATRTEGYASARMEIGGSPNARSLGQLRAELRSWFGDGTRETWGRLRGRWVQRLHPRHVLVTSGLAVLGKDMPRDHQEIVGGLTGLRAYPVREIAGAGAARLNVEHRWLVSAQVFQVVSLGAAAFYDGAREIGPHTADAPWLHGAGVGLRLSLPRSSQERVARIDIAWPLRPGADGGREPVFSLGSTQAF